MQKLCILSLFAFIVTLAPGCGGDGGGSVIENAEQSDVEKYIADQKAMDAEMEAAQSQ